MHWHACLQVSAAAAAATTAAAAAVAPPLSTPTSAAAIGGLGRVAKFKHARLKNFRSRLLGNTDSMETRSPLTVESHVTVWLGAKILCGDANVLSGDLMNAYGQYVLPHSLKSVQG